VYNPAWGLSCLYGSACNIGLGTRNGGVPLPQQCPWAEQPFREAGPVSMGTGGSQPWSYGF